MTADYRPPPSKYKALSALSVGGVSYPAVMGFISHYIQDWHVGHGATHIIATLVAAGMAAIAAWRTHDEPGKLAQRKEAKLDARLSDFFDRNPEQAAQWAKQAKGK